MIFVFGKIQILQVELIQLQYDEDGNYSLTLKMQLCSLLKKKSTHSDQEKKKTQKNLLFL